MSDRLTQLQQCLDQLVDVFSSGLHYVQLHHPFLPATDPVTGLPIEDTMSDPNHQPVTSEEFTAAMKENSNDLIIKTRQVLTLIDSLPGADVSVVEQATRIKELQEELVRVQEEKVQKLKEKEELEAWVEELIVGVGRDIVESRKPVSEEKST